jgi:hypothetical protein
MILILTRDDINPVLDANGVTVENTAITSFNVTSEQLKSATLIIFLDRMYFRILYDKTSKAEQSTVYEIVTLPIILVIHKTE